MKILLATHNVHKLREFREMLRSFKGLKEVYSLIDFPKYLPPEEVGATFEENAILKATEAAKKLNMIAIADDSGLVVPALGGKPGVKSRRYASDDATDQENKRKLLEEMAGFEEARRSAYYDCVLAVASPRGLLKTLQGRCEGTIAEEERGSAGFGYDALFIKHEYDKTFAELDEGTKNRISHRRKAFEKLSLVLESLIQKER